MLAFVLLILTDTGECQVFKSSLYGKHSKYGEWVQGVFTAIYSDSQETVAIYQKSESAKEAAEDREYIEQHAIRWFILALYGFYFYQVLMRKNHAEADNNPTLAEQRVPIIFKAMSMGFDAEETPEKLCAALVEKWRNMPGVSPEYMVTEGIMNNFNFSIGSGKNSDAFRKKNLIFFQNVRDKRIASALFEFFGEDDADVARVMHLTGDQFGEDGIYRA